MVASSYLDRVQMNVSTTGTGSPLTLTTAYAANANTMVQGGAVNGATYTYVLTEGNNFEIGRGVWSSGAGTLTRTAIVNSMVGGVSGTSPINLLGGGVLAIDVAAEDLALFLSAAGGTLTGAINWATAPTLASAATVNIGAAASNYVIVSGTTTITAFDTIAQGAFRWVRFSGALTLTYNATSLILPGSANYTTAAGDIALLMSEGGGSWRVMDYAPASGLPTSTATTAQYISNVASRALVTDQVWNTGTEIALTSVADASVTVTSATPAVITDTAHGFVGNEPVHFTAATIPTGLTANTEYYVLAAGLTTNTYSVSATRGGSAIATTSTGTTVVRVRRVLVDGSLGSFFSLTLARNITLAKPYNWKAGQNGRLRFIQDATGSRLLVYPNVAAGGWGVAGGTALTLSTAASSEDRLYVDGVSSSLVGLVLAKAWA
jgi:hypothetical protein